MLNTQILEKERLTKLDGFILTYLSENKNIYLNKISLELKTERQKVFYRLKVLENRKFISRNEQKEYSLTKFAKNRFFTNDNIFDQDGIENENIFIGVENIRVNLQKFIKKFEENNLNKEGFYITIFPHIKDRKKLSAWEDFDKKIDDILFNSNIIFKGVGDKKSLDHFLNYQHKVDQDNKNIKHSKQVFYVVNDFYLNRYEDTYTTLALGEYVLTFDYLKESLVIEKNKNFAGLTKHFVNFASEEVGRFVRI